MVVDRFHLMHVTALETEDDALQAIHAEGVESGAIPGQRVQTIVRDDWRAGDRRDLTCQCRPQAGHGISERSLRERQPNRNGSPLGPAGSTCHWSRSMSATASGSFRSLTARLRARHRFHCPLGRSNGWTPCRVSPSRLQRFQVILARTLAAAEAPPVRPPNRTFQLCSNRSARLRRAAPGVQHNPRRRSQSSSGIARHRPGDCSSCGPPLYGNRPSRPPATLIPPVARHRRNPYSDRHRQQSAETVAGAGLSRVLYRFATVQSGPKPQHLNACQVPAARLRPERWKVAGAASRGREHHLEREPSAGNPHTGFNARGEETWSR